jgi:hypothetical protein
LRLTTALATSGSVNPVESFDRFSSENDLYSEHDCAPLWWLPILQKLVMERWVTLAAALPESMMSRWCILWKLVVHSHPTGDAPAPLVSSNGADRSSAAPPRFQIGRSQEVLVRERDLAGMHVHEDIVRLRHEGVRLDPAELNVPFELEG